MTVRNSIIVCPACNHPLISHVWSDPPDDACGDICMVDDCPCFDGILPEDVPEYPPDEREVTITSGQLNHYQRYIEALEAVAEAGECLFMPSGFAVNRKTMKELRNALACAEKVRNESIY